MISQEIEKGILYISANDPYLSEVIKIAGPCTLQPRKRYLHNLLRAIISQQLSGFAADAIINRFFAFYNGKPDPRLIIDTPDAILRTLGLSPQKIKYVKDLSEKIVWGEIRLNKFHLESDNEIIERLTKVKGIGEWTVQMFLIFTLNRLNVLPLNDLGIRKGIMKIYGLSKLPEEKKILALSRKYKWDPYNTIASWYLWKSLEL